MFSSFFLRSFLLHDLVALELIIKFFETEFVGVGDTFDLANAQLLGLIVGAHLGVSEGQCSLNFLEVIRGFLPHTGEFLVQRVLEDLSLVLNFRAPSPTAWVNASVTCAPSLVC